MTKRVRLKKIDFDEVSLVRDGDDPQAEVVLAKSAKSVHEDTPRPTIGSSGDYDTEADMPEIDKSALPPDVVEYIETLEKSVDSIVDAFSDVLDEEDIKALEDGTPDDEDVYIIDEDVVDDEEAPVLKSYIAQLEERVAKAERLAEEERRTRLRAEALKKARSLAPLGDVEELADLILTVNESGDQKLAERIEKIFMAASEQIRKSAIFDEIGKTVSEFDVGGDLGRTVEEITKANPDLTREQAVMKALEQRPELYDEYLKEMG